MSLPALHKLHHFSNNGRTTSIGTTPVAAYVGVPFRGRISFIVATTEGAITSADATVAFALNGTANTAGNLTIPVASAAAGQVVVATPTSPIYVNDGDSISLTASGASGSTIACNFAVYIRDSQ